MSTASQTDTRSIWQSPKFQRRLLWFSGAVLVAGVIVFAVAFFPNTGKDLQAPLTNEPAQDVSGTPKTVQLDPVARRIAGQFIQTAVSRRNLDDAWKISGPHIRQGMSYKEWLRGEIPVVPYPAEAIDLVTMKVDLSQKNTALLEVAILPKAGYRIKPQIFFLGLIKVGPTGDKHWVVDSWVPRASPLVPSGAEHTGS